MGGARQWQRTCSQILHEDEDLLVINKPAGLVCHPTKGDERSSLAGRLRLYRGAEVPVHLINRLDRETSGVVCVAKTETAARASCGSYGRAAQWKSNTGRSCTGTWLTRKE